MRLIVERDTPERRETRLGLCAARCKSSAMFILVVYRAWHTCCKGGTCLTYFERVTHPWWKACPVEGKITLSARRQITNKLRDTYQKATKPDKSRVLDEVVATTGLARSSARRLLTGPRLPAPNEQVDKRSLRLRSYSDAARELLVHVWKLMGLPCGKYLVVMLPQWLPLLEAAGDLDHPFGTPDTVAELESMSAATVDRYLAPARAVFELKGKSATSPGPLLRNSIAIRKAGDELEDVPGMLECDTVAHCGPTLQGEFARTLTMTDMSTGWTECGSIRNNASKWILETVETLRESFPFPVTGFDSDNGSEFINHDVADWLQTQDIAFTRSRPYKKNDQATVESKNNHVVRKNAFYWRYDTAEERELLNELWRLVSLKLNFFTPTKKPVGYSETKSGRRRRIYDAPATPWQRVKRSGVPVDIAEVEQRIAGINPADLTREVTRLQNKLTRLSAEKTRAMSESRRLDMTSLERSIQRLQPK